MVDATKGQGNAGSRALVLMMALKEAGRKADYAECLRWMSGQEEYPISVRPFIESVLTNFKYHQAIATLALLEDSETTAHVLEAIVKDPAVVKAQLHARALRRDGYCQIYVRMLLTTEEFQTFEEVRKAARWKRAELLTRLVQIVTGEVGRRMSLAKERAKAGGGPKPPPPVHPAKALAVARERGSAVLEVVQAIGPGDPKPRTP